MRQLPIVAAVSVLLIAGIVRDVAAQGYFNRTAVRNPVTGRQEIVDLHRPQFSGGGQGGMMFDGASGSLQVTAVRRNRFTGRLEYYNEYMNPWTGARYSTGTQFNPFTGRYQTQHNFLPPPPRQNASTTETAAVITTAPLPKRGIRVIETKFPEEEPPAPVAPPVELSEQSQADLPAPPETKIEIRVPETESK